MLFTLFPMGQNGPLSRGCLLCACSGWLILPMHLRGTPESMEANTSWLYFHYGKSPGFEDMWGNLGSNSSGRHCSAFLTFPLSGTREASRLPRSREGCRCEVCNDQLSCHQQASLQRMRIGGERADGTMNHILGKNSRGRCWMSLLCSIPKTLCWQGHITTNRKWGGFVGMGGKTWLVARSSSAGR